LIGVGAARTPLFEQLFEWFLRDQWPADIDVRASGSAGPANQAHRPSVLGERISC